MLIAIEAERANHPQKTGVEHYAKQLILQFAKLDTQNQFILYLRTVPEEWIKNLPKNFTYKVMPFPIFWTHLRVSLELLLHPVDVLFVPASALPIYSPKNSVAVIHDAAFLFYPESFTWFMRNFLHWSYKYIGWKARKIIAVSNATKDDLIKYYKINPDKIEVVWHGYTPMNPPVIPTKVETHNKLTDLQTEGAGTKYMDPGYPDQEHRDSGMTEINNSHLKSQFSSLPQNFLLFLSTLQPRKNLEGLIDAFRIFKNKHPESEYKLVVAGKVGWKAGEILENIKRNQDIVVYLNHVSDNQRDWLYSNATALAVPSFYEGFGMWILEAFEANIPVITSNVSSMPEVAEEAAEYSDPHNIESIERAIENVLLNKERATQLVVLGKERLKLFSWEKCGKETLDILMGRHPNV